MIEVEVGQVWRADVPFNDEPNAGKYRPVLVLGYSRFGKDEDNVVLVVSITTHGGRGVGRGGDVPLSAQEATAAGLRSAGWVRARRLWGLDPRALDSDKGPTGFVSEDLMSDVLKEVQRLFAV